jgi:hypothetical protein
MAEQPSTPDGKSIEEQVSQSLDAIFGAAVEPVVEVAPTPPPALQEVPELLRTNALYGGG